MIYKFKVWSWKPMYTEIYLVALEDDEAVNTSVSYTHLTLPTNREV